MTLRDDRHQDHRIVSDLTWNTFRDRAPEGYAEAFYARKARLTL